MHAGTSATRIWLLLLALTGITFAAGKAHLEGPALVLSVLGIALYKGRLVAWHFMELQRVRPLWRGILGGYLAMVGLLVAVAFLITTA
ncbi:cytochrome C oxidase subunit IV family protein [Thiohalorhabdus methylotrophus]|uniref:Cytochrome C oxidase subunit IV family protein n=1 Tax=Thiohalorhabdus methylotrophus TaxID=3242694 RepID=A0ABV4TU89_9GAMM